MAGRVTVNSPFDEGNVVELGRKLFRKQLLPKAKIDYKGRELNFDDAYLDNVAQSYRDQAFDSCPLVMADAENRHTMSPTAATGSIVGVERTPDGLDILVEANDEAARVLSENPRVGVSARIVEEFSRSDGKSWPAALQHALITFAPRIPGLRPWQAVECSDESEHVIDLSALVFTADGDAVAPKPPVSTAPGADTDPAERGDTEEPVATLTDEQLAKLLKLIEGDGANSVADDAAPTTDDKPEATVTPIVKPEPAAPAAEADTDAEAEQAIAAAVGDDENNVVDLAMVELRTIADRQAIELAEIRAERDQEKWNYEREQLVRKDGIPPAIVNLAEPLLKGAKHVVELSDGSSVDAGAVMRSVLTAVPKAYGRKAVDLSAPTGSALDADAADEAAAARKRIHDAARASGFGK